LYDLDISIRGLPFGAIETSLVGSGAPLPARREVHKQPVKKTDSAILSFEYINRSDQQGGSK